MNWDFCTTRAVYSTVHIFLYYPGNIQYCPYVSVLSGPYTILYIYFCSSRTIYSTVHIFLYYPDHIQYCTYMSVLSWTIYSTVHIFLYSPDHIQYCTYISVLPGPYTVLNIYFCTTRVIHSTVHIFLYYLGHIQYWNTFLYFPGHIQYCTYISVLPGPYTVLYICFRTTQTIYSTVHIFLYYPGYIPLYLFFYTNQANNRIYCNVPVFLLYCTVRRYDKIKRMIESILNALMFIQVELINFIEFINCLTIQHACQK